MPRTRHRDALHEQMDMRERVRKMEVMGDARTLQVHPPVADNAVVDVLIDLVALWWNGDTVLAENNFAGHPTSHTARAIRDAIWNQGFWPDWSEAYEYYNDESWPPAGEHPLALYPAHLTGHYQETAREFMQFMMDVGAFPNISSFAPQYPVPSVGPVSYPGGVAAWVTGGAISGLTPANIQKWAHQFYFHGLTTLGGDHIGWRFLPARGVDGVSDFGASYSGCAPAPDVPRAGGSQRLWRTSPDYDSTNPWRQDEYNFGYNEGAWAAIHSNVYPTGHQWGEYYNGKYRDPPSGEAFEIKPCLGPSDDEEVEIWQALDIPKAAPVPGIPTAPWLGHVICPQGQADNGQLAIDCTGVYIGARTFEPMECRPLVAPFPCMVDYSGAATWEAQDNVYLGFGATPYLTWPGREAMRTRITDQIAAYGYTRFLSMIARMVGYEWEDGIPQFGPARFKGDGRWTACRIAAPWRGNVQVQRVGDRIHFRGWVMNWSNQSSDHQDPIVELPAGMPIPDITDNSQSRTKLLAHVAKIERYKMVPDYWYYNSQIEPGATMYDPPIYPEGGYIEPPGNFYDIGKAGHMCPVRLEKRSGTGQPTKWWAFCAPTGGSDFPLLDTGASVAIFDGMNYICNPDVLTT